jgi:hypothetical protein
MCWLVDNVCHMPESVTESSVPIGCLNVTWLQYMVVRHGDRDGSDHCTCGDPAWVQGPAWSLTWKVAGAQPSKWAA